MQSGVRGLYRRATTIGAVGRDAKNEGYGGHAFGDRGCGSEPCEDAHGLAHQRSAAGLEKKMLRYEKLSGLHAGVADHETFVQAPEKAGQDMTRHVYVASGAGAHA